MWLKEELFAAWPVRAADVGETFRCAPDCTFSSRDLRVAVTHRLGCWRHRRWGALLDDELRASVIRTELCNADG